jgi:hypothetical protein
MMIAPTVILAVLIIPIFRIMVHLRSAGSLYAGVVLINALISLGFTPIFIYLSEAMPPRARRHRLGSCTQSPSRCSAGPHSLSSPGSLRPQGIT